MTRAPGSEQAWGIPLSRNRRSSEFRFTPTGVGNTLDFCEFANCHTVHPHRRGEYSPCDTQYADSSGSPPQAWGILFSAGKTNSPARFTPTGVGNTSFEGQSRHIHTVHPHRRGEYFFILSSPVFLAGSPPQAWGIHNE